MLNGRYGRVQESYLRDLGVRGDESKLYLTGTTETFSNDIMFHIKLSIKILIKMCHI